MRRTAEILAIGDELVHGKVVDTNSAWLAAELAALGMAPAHISVVGDGEQEVCRAMRSACERADVLVVTGGLGPTEDDRTRRAAALLADQPLRFDEASWRHIQAVLKVYGREGLPVPDSNRRQAEFPQGARVLQNDWGSAPGFAMEVLGCTLYALPGVPREMKAMWGAHPLPELRTGNDHAVHAHSMHVVGCREAELGERLAGFMGEAQSTKVGITASGGQLTVRVFGLDVAKVEATVQQVRPLLGQQLIYEGEHSLAEEVGRRLIDQDISLALAESCTGGLVAAALTEVAGISAVFRAGFVTYSNAAKQRDVGVDAGLLQQYGAVSEPVAGAMARGAAERAEARAAVAVTGIAGPGGGTAEKPVGMVCFGVHFDGETQTFERQFGDLGRHLLRRRVVREALVALYRCLPGG